MENGKQERPSVRTRALRDFKELEAWRFARRLRTEMYRLTKTFPAEERFGLASQMRRAAVSVTANLAEGYGRFSYQENMQFCRQSRGSVFELRDHLTTALDVGYLRKEKYLELEELALSVIRLLNGYIRKTGALKDAAGKALA